MPTLEARELTFPPTCDTVQKKLAYTCRAQEMLRYLHNVLSKWTHKGLTQKEYDLGVDVSEVDGILVKTVITDKLKALYPYKPRMTVAEMEAYIKNEHKPRQNALKIGHRRAEFDTSMIETLGMEPQFDEDGKRDLNAELITYEHGVQAMTTWDNAIKVEDI